jgi:hypothetical protein
VGQARPSAAARPPRTAPSRTAPPPRRPPSRIRTVLTPLILGLAAVIAILVPLLTSR